ncbi:trypsin-like serine protease [Pseudoduganella violaceinigra]|uniref:trypsin-like serine protease n=1 Tax=Pseudoduganella violaceinigra TaxID=246602 RepID=UPI00042466E8|nr:trypsin-like serine protease [Pseudoduganella violaceinigra]
MAKPIWKQLLGFTLVIATLAGTAQATPGGTITPLISAGAPPDSPAARVDPNTAASPFSGVVSINIRYDGLSYICSGALVGKRQVVSAGHCVDTDGNGSVIDLNKPGNDVRVIFNASSTPGDPGRAAITASKVQMNPNYAGFGNCPAGVPGFCVNDDLSVITLSQDAPAAARIYKIAGQQLEANTRIIMAGYGTSGDGINGYTIGPDFRVKRTGQNVVDFFDQDDEQDFNGPREVWYADFDGNGHDTFCEFGLACSRVLANGEEANIGGGDSGGPSFIESYGELMLIATNTFGGTPDGINKGAFGSYFGGIVLHSYLDYLRQATGGAATVVPEPASIAVFGLGLLALAGARRRKQQRSA